MDKNQPLLKNMNIPYKLIYIQPIYTQVWSCDEIGLDPNEKLEWFRLQLEVFFRWINVED